MHCMYKLGTYIMPTCQIVFMAEAWRLLLQRLHIIIEANSVTVKNMGAFIGGAPDVLSRIMRIAANPYHDSSISALCSGCMDCWICCCYCCLGIAPRAQLLKKSTWLLHTNW